MREVKVCAFQTGYCMHPQIMSVRDGSWRPVPFPALSMLLIHPEEGPILFDTGYDPAFIEATKPFPERFYRWILPVSLESGGDMASQLERLGIAANDVRHVILSHFHADHIAGTHAFPNATIHCAKAGLDAACTGGRVTSLRRGILPALIPANILTRARFFEDCPPVALPSELAPFDLAADVLGDGSILAVELPGHCPGHWGIVVGDDVRGTHFMVADAAWSSDAIRRNVPPPAIATGFLGNSHKVRETLANLHRLWRRNPEVHLTPCHCPEKAAQARASR